MLKYMVILWDFPCDSACVEVGNIMTHVLRVVSPSFHQNAQALVARLQRFM